MCEPLNMKLTLDACGCRWSALLEEIAVQLRSSKALLQLWQRYKELYGQSAKNVQCAGVRVCDRLLKTAANKDMSDQEVSVWIQDCSVSTGGCVECVCVSVCV